MHIASYLHIWFTYSESTVDKDISMVPISLTAKKDENPAKLEAEMSHKMSTIAEVRYVMIDKGSSIGSNTDSRQYEELDKLSSNVRSINIW